MTPAANRRFSRAWAVVIVAAVSCDSGGAPSASRGASTRTPAQLSLCVFPKGPAAVPASVTLETICGCKRLDGDLFIDASAVRDIRCLHSLREITGTLEISAPHGPPLLANLNGLEQLQKVRTLSLSGLLAPDLRGLESVAWSELRLEKNAELRSLDGLAVPETITSVTLTDNPKLEQVRALHRARVAGAVVFMRLPALATLEGLHGSIGSLRISQSDKLTDLRGLNANVNEFWLEKNAGLRSLQGFAGLEAQPGARSGLSVRIETHPELESLDGLFRSEHPRLERLALMGLPKIESVDARAPRELGALVVRGCTALQSIRGVDSVEAIGQLHLTGLSALRSLPSLKKLQRVGDLELIELPLIRDLASLSHVLSVEKISLSMLDALTSLRGLEKVASAQRILIEDLLALETLDGLRGLTTVDTLWIQNDDKLKSLRGLRLKSARELAVRDNDALRTLDGLDRLEHAGTLDVSGNPQLGSLRALDRARVDKLYTRANGTN